MHKVFFISLIFLLSNQMFAQNITGGVYGRVFDFTTKQPIPFANVLVLETNFGAATNDAGLFKIESLPVQTYQIRASVIGYNAQIKTDVVVQTGKPAEVNFELVPQAIEFDGITVTSDYFRKDPLEVNSIRSFSYEEIRRSPGGFEDVIRALSILPGVAQADAGRNDLIVRGGAPSENLYLINGIEVPNINHFGTQGATGGPLSYVNLDFVRETSFSTGGFSALYGDKLSSVLNINLREGREDRFGGKGTISASQFGLNLEGPITQNSNFIFSARRSYLDFIFKAANFSFVPEYYDVLLKADFSPHTQDAFSFLFISAFDNVKFFNDDADQRFDNSRILGTDQVQYVAGFTYRHLFTDGFFNLALSRNYVDYDSRQIDSLLNPIFTNKSKEEENSLRADLVFKLSKASEINIGGTAKLIEADFDILFPNFFTTFGDSLPVTSLKTENTYTKFGVYTNYNTLLFNRLTANVGIRSDIFTALNKKIYFSPRLSLSYALTDLTNINFSTGIYNQSPSYIWLEAFESNRDLKMIQVNQFVLGFDHRISADALLKVEAFYKDYKNYPTSTVRPYLVLANTGAGFTGSDDNYSSFGLEPLVDAGYGKARGVELSIQKKLSDIPYYGIFSFTYSKSDYTSLDGIERSGSYDQNWIINLSGGYKFDEFWEVSSKFRFASGRPYTPFNFDGTQNIIDYNTRRIKSTHSLDVRVDKRWYFSGWTLITYVDIQNIYNQNNQNGVRWDRREMRTDESSS
ncbi:MAG TPA: TonB-dependent receptor, partial [Ignavibacteriaceae bacterium]|nr:TonB-dependent receptor [Ignavibacteriaceae bacterium]HRQ53606.1 TonB-dependent receptor [Ignavibacteriaceae bacterium]